jgi:hypothetical protein
LSCRCRAKPCSCLPASRGGGCNPAGRGPDVEQLPGNTPPGLDSLACTVAGRIQAAVDQGRLVSHRLGFRPYRVRLVWQVRDAITAEWSTANGGAELELMPVKVSGIAEIGLEIIHAGRTTDGTIKLTEISTLQANEELLLGYRDGKPWGNADPSREFFYEIQPLKICATDPEPANLRLIPNGKPELDMVNSQWIVRLVDQFGERTPAGLDQTTPSSWVATVPRLIP